MTTRITLGLLVTAAGIVTAAAVGTRPPDIPGASLSGAEDVTSGSPIESLDRCIQKRLHEHTGFGMSRLVDSLLQVREFRPESPEEAEALSTLSRAGWTVGLYLGGRDLMASGSDGPVADAGVSPPIAVTDRNRASELPDPRDLRELGRKALAESERADSVEGRVGRWSVDARVVRADRAACLTCHTRDGAQGFPSRDRPVAGQLEVGDALGVAFYVYVRGRGAEVTRPNP